MLKSWYRLCRFIQSQRTALLLNLAVILPFALLTVQSVHLTQVTVNSSSNTDPVVEPTAVHRVR